MWKNVCVSPDTPIREVVKVIDTYALQIALVVQEDYVLRYSKRPFKRRGSRKPGPAHL